MITIECPLCGTDATVDSAITQLRCDHCGIPVEVAPDPSPATGLDLAA